MVVVAETKVYQMRANLISVGWTGWMGEWPVPRFPAGNGIRRDGRDRKPVLVVFVVGGGDHFEQLELRRGTETRRGGEHKAATD